MQDAQAGTGRVVVGVDGSVRNLAALEWAVAEAVRRARPLHLVSVACKASTPPAPWTGDSTIQYSLAETEQMVDRLRRRFGAEVAEVTAEVPVGTPSKQLLKTLRAGDELVVGRRGVSPAERVILGSTSIEAAGRSPVPTVIVPDDWEQPQHVSGVVVAGVDGTERDEPVLDFGFAGATAAGTTLLVVHAREEPPPNAWEGSHVQVWTKEAEAALVERLEPWTRRFPEVRLVCRAPAVAPGRALLDASVDAQMVVLGRFAGVHHLVGFSGFSTCRRVLHHARCPVSVVPVPADASAGTPGDLAFDETDQPEF
jgi:nucleotide-binding universal stress UspA family protein